MSQLSSLAPWFPPAAEGNISPKPLRAIGIIGTGTNGTGIAHWCATKGMGVMLHDLEANSLTQGVGIVRGLFKQAEARNEISAAAAHRAMGGISITTGMEDMEFCDAIIDTLAEDLSAKVSRFERMARSLPSDLLLASCASAADLAEISAKIASPERVIGLTFLDPVHESPQVRVTLTSATSRLTAERVVAFIESLGKQASIEGPGKSTG